MKPFFSYHTRVMETFLYLILVYRYIDIQMYMFYFIFSRSPNSLSFYICMYYLWYTYNYVYHFYQGRLIVRPCFYYFLFHIFIAIFETRENETNKVHIYIYTHTSMGVLLFSNKHVVFCEFWEEVKTRTN